MNELDELEAMYVGWMRRVKVAGWRPEPTFDASRYDDAPIDHESLRRAAVAVALWRLLVGSEPKKETC